MIVYRTHFFLYQMFGISADVVRYFLIDFLILNFTDVYIWRILVIITFLYCVYFFISTFFPIVFTNYWFFLLFWITSFFCNRLIFTVAVNYRVLLDSKFCYNSCLVYCIRESLYLCTCTSYFFLITTRLFYNTQSLGHLSLGSLFP